MAGNNSIFSLFFRREDSQGGNVRSSTRLEAEYEQSRLRPAFNPHRGATVILVSEIRPVNHSRSSASFLRLCLTTVQTEGCGVSCQLGEIFVMSSLSII